MKKLFALFLSASMLTALSASVNAVDSTSCSYALYEANSGTVLRGSNIDTPMPAGGTAKLMLLAIAAEKIEDGSLSLSDTAVCPNEVRGVKGAVIWLVPGEEMTVDELLKSVIIGGANDAALCLAAHIAGSADAFTALMNEKARQMKLSGTVYGGVCGFDDEKSITTARDAATLSGSIINAGIYEEYMTTRLSYAREGTDNSAQLLNRNKLIGKYKGLNGLMACRSDESGWCVSAGAERGKMRLVSVVLGAESEEESFSMASDALDGGFSDYAVVFPAPPEKMAEGISVIGGINKAVRIEVLALPPLVVPAAGGELRYEVLLPESVEAPVAAGSTVGILKVYLDKEVIWRTAIVSRDEAEKLSIWKSGELIWDELLSF